MENVLTAVQVKFKTLFPHSAINVRKSALYDESRPSFVIVMTLKNGNYPNGIIENDAMYHVAYVATAGDKIMAEMVVGGLSVLPKERYLAMSHEKIKFRKKTGTEAQVIKHFDKWLDELKSTVVSNRDKIYNGEQYQEFIV